MPLAFYITLALAVLVCTATILYGVPLDHIRQQRRNRSAETRRACKEQWRQRAQALDPTGGSFRNCEGPRS